MYIDINSNIYIFFLFERPHIATMNVSKLSRRHRPSPPQHNLPSLAVSPCPLYF